jgi:hypothetical protein
VDDICDGIISCEIVSAPEPVCAHARVVVTPPDYAPDRRPFATIADGLKDRMDRDEVLESKYMEVKAPPGAPAPLLVDLEVCDLMERILETMGLINVDVYNDRVNVIANPNIQYLQGLPMGAKERIKAFRPPVSIDHEPFPLTERGRQHHRRFVVLQVFTQVVQQAPDLLEKVIRQPLSENPYFTTQMPPGMRGAYGGPLHLTRRQCDLLIAWARKISRP